MTALMVVGLVLASVAALLHVLFFVLESVLFRHPRGRRLFGVRAEHDSPPLRLFDLPWVSRTVL
jgi:putative membrane protein